MTLNDLSMTFYVLQTVLLSAYIMYERNWTSYVNSYFWRHIRPQGLLLWCWARPVSNSWISCIYR